MGMLSHLCPRRTPLGLLGVSVCHGSVILHSYNYLCCNQPLQWELLIEFSKYQHQGKKSEEPFWSNSFVLHY